MSNTMTSHALLEQRVNHMEIHLLALLELTLQDPPLAPSDMPGGSVRAYYEQLRAKVKEDLLRREREGVSSLTTADPLLRIGERESEDGEKLEVTAPLPWVDDRTGGCTADSPMLGRIHTVGIRYAVKKVQIGSVARFQTLAEPTPTKDGSHLHFGDSIDFESKSFSTLEAARDHCQQHEESLLLLHKPGKKPKG